MRLSLLSTSLRTSSPRRATSAVRSSSGATAPVPSGALALVLSLFATARASGTTLVSRPTARGLVVATRLARAAFTARLAGDLLLRARRILELRNDRADRARRRAGQHFRGGLAHRRLGRASGG